MANYRFRNEGELLVLQVYVPPKVSHYTYGETGTWRDANVTDFDASQLTGPFNVTLPERDAGLMINGCPVLQDDGSVRSHW